MVSNGTRQERVNKSNLRVCKYSNREERVNLFQEYRLSRLDQILSMKSQFRKTILDINLLKLFSRNYMTILTITFGGYLQRLIPNM